MGQKTVRFSDLSGQLITEEDTLARVVVLEHPELGDSPVEFEALADEALAVDKAALRVAVLELHLPGEEEPRRVTVDLDGFDAMATDTAMSELLITARPARRAARSATATSTRGSRASSRTPREPGPQPMSRTSGSGRPVPSSTASIRAAISPPAGARMAPPRGAAGGSGGTGNSPVGR